MTEFPQLAEALDAAARRHYAPSRLRPVRRAVRPLVLIAAIALLALVMRPDGAAPPDERAAEPATFAGTYGEHFEVFRRPRGPGDDLPGRDFMPAPGFRGLDHDRSRLAWTLGKVAVYLVPRADDEPGLCMLTFVEGRPASTSCTTLEAASDEAKPMASLGRSQDEKNGVTQSLFPDGVRDVRLTLSDGSVLSGEVRGNVLLAAHDVPVTSLSWTGPSGERHALGAPDPDPTRTPADRGCVDNEPLPAGAEQEAERVARAAVPRLLPDDDGTVLAERGGDEDPRLETLEKACGAQARAQTLVFDFRTGSITVTQVAGRLQVFSVLDR